MDPNTFSDFQKFAHEIVGRKITLCGATETGQIIIEVDNGLKIIVHANDPNEAVRGWRTHSLNASQLIREDRLQRD